MSFHWLKTCFCPSIAPASRTGAPNKMDKSSPPSSRLASILTDTHFWVPVAVLIAGLLLLHSIH